jgi:flavodoxin
MRSVVVCESWFGNTDKVAQAITDELARHGEAKLVSVGERPGELEQIDLLVVGGPTHAHGMSSSMTRRGALEQAHGEPEDAGPGVRGWLKELPKVDRGMAAAFDTRIEKPTVLVGSAAKGIGKRLRRHGFELVAPPESFFVLDSEGPLKDGELERATAWAEQLANAAVTAAPR